MDYYYLLRELPAAHQSTINHGLVEAIKSDDDKKVEKLLDEGADPNHYSDKDRLNVLFLAFAYSDSSLSLLLLHPRIDLTVKDGDGNTILHYLAKYGMNDIITAIDFTNIINIGNNNGKVPLQIAIFNGNFTTVKLLINHQAKINNDIINNYIVCFMLYGDDANEFFKVMLNKMESISDENIKSWVVTAVTATNYTIFDYLVEHYPMQSRKAMEYLDDKGNTLLHLAKLDMPAKLLKYIDVNSINDDGNTCLHIVIYDKFKIYHKLVTLLLNHGADLTIKNKNGETVKDILTRNGNKEILKMIELHENTSMDVKVPDA